MIDVHTLPLKPRKHAKPWRESDDAYLIDHAGVDPSILAEELRRPLRHTLKRMRFLGLRKCTCAPRKSDVEYRSHA